jgi:hypothetical protein
MRLVMMLGLQWEPEWLAVANYSTLERVQLAGRVATGLVPVSLLLQTSYDVIEVGPVAPVDSEEVQPAG